MSTQLDSTTNTNAATDTRRIDRYVRTQLRKTTQQVRLSDIFSALLIQASFMVAFFFVCAVVDAWLSEMTHFGRWLALVFFLVGNALIVWFLLVPLLVRKINPRYAAKLIEQARPGFKNSLLNYLELRQQRKTVPRAIFGEVSKRAATDLSATPIDSVVDKTNLIRVGFALVGLAAIFVAYLMISPKSPFPTIWRIFAPGSRIARPAAVSVEVISPRDTSVFFGDRPEVTARIGGEHDSDDVQLVYSTTDGQVVDAVLPMNLDADGLYSVNLGTQTAGIQQALIYHVQARDGKSPDYTLAVRPNPSIAVNSVEISPPPYTRLPSRTESFGEIDAPEGSDIRITATANLPAEVAYIVPLVAEETGAGKPRYRELRTIPMKADGTLASGHFVAMLNANRDRSLFTHYKIKFTSADGFQNERANIYPIRVRADLAPEVEIVSPAQQEIVVPVNQPLAVTIRAADLDFEISSVSLHIDHDGPRILDREWKLPLQNEELERGGPVSGTIRFTPSEENMKPGDRVFMFATASDNRISPTSKLPDPNISRTENYTLIISDPVDNPSPNQTEPEAPADPNQSGENPESDGDQQPGNSQSDTESDRQQRDAENQDGESNSDAERSPGGGDDYSDSGQSENQEGAAGTSESGSEGADGGNNQNRDGDSSQAEDSSAKSDSADPGLSSDQTGQRAGDNGDQKPSNDPTAGGSDSNNEDPNSGQSGAGQQRDAQGSEDQTDGNQSATVSGSEMQDSDGSQEKNGTANGGSQQARPDSNPSGNNTSENGANSGTSSADQEFRDRQLSEGDRQPLDRNAPQGDQFERLKEYFDQQKGDGGENQNNDPSGNRTSNRQQEPTGPEMNPEPDESPGQRNNGSDDESSKTVGSQENTKQTDESAGDSLTQDRQGNSSDGEPASSEQNNSDRDGDLREKSNNDPRGSSGDATDSESDPSKNDDRDVSGGDKESENQTPGSSDAEQPANSESGNQTADSPSSGSTKADSANTDSKSSQSSGSSGGSEAQTQDQDQNRSGEPSSPSGESASGSETGDGEPSSGTKSDSEAGDRSPQESSQSNSDSQSPDSDSDSPESQLEKSAENPSSESARQNGTGGSTGRTSSGDAQETVADDANLEYAKKVTDLVLENLEDQKFEPDEELLEQMNWTRQDLENFLANWREMKNRADRGEPGGRRVYEDALRSLDLDRDASGRTVKAKRDQMYRLNEEGAVDQIPADLVDEFQSFLKKRNRSKRSK